MQLAHLRGALAALCLCGSAAALAAPTLIGDTLDFMRAYPDVVTQFGASIPSTTVAAGTSDVVNWQGLAFFDPEANSISFNLPFLTGFLGTSTNFDGFIVSGFDTDIASVSLISNTTDFVIGLTHDLRSLAVNIGAGNTQYSTGTFVIGIKLADTPGVDLPEPATAGLAGLALAALGLRRRTATRRAVA